MSISDIARQGLLMLFCLVAPTVCVADPFIVGVATHSMNNLEQPLRSLSQASDAGITSIRDDAFWSTAEPAPDQLRIIPAWRAWLSSAKTLNLSPMVILGYGTSFNGNAKPRTPEVKAPYLRYVDYITRQFGNPVSFYEVWNEWDIEGPADPKLSRDYVAVVREAAPIIRTNNPQAKVLAGAVTTAGIKGGFVDRIVADGVLQYVDGLSLHPYVHCEGQARNTPEHWINWLRELDRRLTAKVGKSVPLYLTEMSWPAHEGPCGVSASIQSAYLARSYFLARTLPSIKGMWWYDLINDGTRRDDQEHNFGLLNVDLSAKPAYSVLKVISPFLQDFTYDPTSSLQADGVFKLVFSRGDERIMVAWASGRQRDEKISAPGMQNGPLRMIDTQQPDQGMSDSPQRWSCNNQRCSATVTLTDFPKIIRLREN